MESKYYKNKKIGGMLNFNMRVERHNDSSVALIEDDDGNVYKFDEDGHLQSIEDKNGKMLKKVWWENGELYEYVDYEYDENGIDRAAGIHV